MSISLRNDMCVFVGPPDSGKSNLVKWLLRQDAYRRHLVYDPLFGYDPEDLHVIRPPSRSTKWRRYDHGNAELNRAVDKFVLDVPRGKRPHYFIVDEAGRLLPNKQDEGEAMGELNDFNAHYGVGVWIVGQRFAQINSDIKNKAQHYFVHGYKGKNDRDMLMNIHRDLPDLVDRIKTRDPYGFAYSGHHGDLRGFRSVPLVGEKAKL